MTFRFVHTADWHIGKPFGRFSAEQASVLRRARLDAIDRLAAVGRGGGATTVLVAGDVYDGPGLADRVLMELMGRLAAHRDLSWYVIPGNHDPATAGGTWDRLARLGIPDNVHVLRAAAPMDIAPGVVLLPAPLATKAVTSDPTAWMSSAPTPESTVRIGLAHGSTQGFGSEGLARVAIEPARARQAGLAYLALGDWHGTREIARATWYSGTPEPDSYQDNDPGNALLVTIEGPNAVPLVERHKTGAMTWLGRRLTMRGAHDLRSLVAEVDAAETAASRLLVDITLDGEVTVGEDGLIRDALVRLEPRIFHLRVSLEALALAPKHDELTALSDPILRDIANDLSAAARGNGPEAAIAAQALRRLFQAARALEVVA